MTYIYQAFGALQAQSRILALLLLVAPVSILVLDYQPPNLWHDLWQIATTIIGTLLIVIFRQYLKNQADLKKAIEKLEADRENIVADVRIAYAKELGIQHKRQDKIIEILVQIIFKLFPKDDGDSGHELQKMVRDLMDSGV